MPMTAGSLAYLVLPGSLKTKQLHHLQPGTHWGRPKSSRAASGVNFCRWSTCRGGDKATVECQGNVANKKNQKPSHQLCKLNIKSTQADSVSIEYIKGKWEFPHTKTNTLALPAVDTGGKNTQEQGHDKVSCPLSRSESGPVLEGILGRWRLTVTYSEGEDAGSWDPKKTISFYPYIFICSIVGSGFSSSFFICCCGYRFYYYC